MLVRYRGDVGHDQAGQPSGMAQRHGHRRLAAHGMPQHHRPAAAKPVDRLGQVGGHVRVSVGLVPRAVAMVPHIDHHYASAGRKPAPQRVEIAR